MIELRYGGQPIRAYINDGRTWFVASDLARALGFRSGFALARTVPAEDKKLLNVETAGGHQKSTVISDTGLFVFASRTHKPFGGELRQWILREALPGLS